MERNAFSLENYIFEMRFDRKSADFSENEMKRGHEGHFREIWHFLAFFAVFEKYFRGQKCISCDRNEWF